MKFPALYLFVLASVAFLIPAAAVPIDAALNGTLTKRGGEVNYLTNCYQTDGATTYQVSHAAWYADVDASLKGEWPNAVANTGSSGWTLWEGTQNEFWYDSSKTVIQTHIDKDAQSRAFTAWAGYVIRENDGRWFNCYKDNYRQLFQIKTPYAVTINDVHILTCNSLYWCV